MFRKIACLSSVLLVAACNTTSVMPIPTVVQPERVAIDPNKELAAIGFKKAISSIRTGTVIAHFPPSAPNLGGTLCNQYHEGKSTLEWTPGSRYLGSWNDEVGVIFTETMQGAGYNVVGNANKLFETGEDLSAADYQVAARVEEIRGNICQETDWWTGYAQQTFRAEAYIKVDWAIYNPRARQEVGTITTEGYHLKKNSSKQAFLEAVLAAFAASADSLANNTKFYDLISQTQTARLQEWVPKEQSGIGIDNVPIYSRSIQKNIGKILRGVVTLRGSRGHGSGFAISDRGYILTNAHVVGKSKKIQVIFNSGLEVSGKVIRKDEFRDVALVKVDIQGLQPLPLRSNRPVKHLDTVIAIGSPLDESMKATVTRGAVSAFREFENERGLVYIQADVDISGGNSGGPLVDEQGNVVAITVAGIGMGAGKTSVGLNLFIPIKDAMDALNIIKRN